MLFAKLGLLAGWQAKVESPAFHAAFDRRQRKCISHLGKIFCINVPQMFRVAQQSRRGQNVFDVFTKSSEKARDGIAYSEW